MTFEHDLNSYKTDELVIQAGQVTFFTFTRRDGFVWTLPPAPGGTFIPPDATPVGAEGEILPIP
jgi:hypothetical protein